MRLMVIWISLLVSIAQATPEPVLSGFDPVALVAGQQLPGKRNIKLEHRGQTYWFDSSENRAAFLNNPTAFEIQNQTCPVMPGVQAQTDIFAAYQGKIYIFGSEQCRERFIEQPSIFLNRHNATQNLRHIPTQFNSGDLSIHAQIILPHTDPPHLAAVLIHGSGDADQHQAWAIEIARGLASEGIAILVPDKRGSGRTGGNWREVGYHELALDANAALHHLKQRYPKAAIGHIGISEGGTVAPIAATLAQSDFVISLSSSALPLIDVAYHQYSNAVLKQPFTLSERNIALALHSALEEHILTDSKESWHRYAVLLSQAQQSAALKQFIIGLPEYRTSWQWHWWRRNQAIKPVNYWRRVEAPKLAVFGRLDDLDKVPVSRSIRTLHSAQHKMDILLLDNVGHSLRKQGAVIEPAVFADLALWIRTNSRIK